MREKLFKENKSIKLKDLLLFGRSKSLAEDTSIVNKNKLVPFIEENPQKYNRDVFIRQLEEEAVEYEKNIVK